MLVQVAVGHARWFWVDQSEVLLSAKVLYVSTGTTDGGLFILTYIVRPRVPVDDGGRPNDFWELRRALTTFNLFNLEAIESC